MLGALAKEFTPDTSIDEVRGSIADREGRVADVSWSDVRQMLNNLMEVYEEECDDLAGLLRSRAQAPAPVWPQRLRTIAPRRSLRSESRETINSVRRRERCLRNTGLNSTTMMGAGLGR